MPRILIVSHLHPLYSKGGAETAAYNLYRTLKADPRNRCFFFAAAAGKGASHLGSPIVSSHERPDEFLLAQSNFDHFLQSQRSTDIVWHDFGELLRELEPEIVHFHHYTHLGVEFLRAVRHNCPEAALVVTLHEYLAICRNHGQMLKTERYELCSRASPQDCHGCYPEVDSREFFLRELFIKSFLELVDLFISPSRFLRDRYVDWGLPAQKFVVLENGTAEAAAAGDGAAVIGDGVTGGRATEAGVTTRLGFFGQLSELKGIFVLLAAMKELKRRGRDDIGLTIHGDYSYQKAEFRQAFEEEVAALAPAVSFAGPYVNTDVGRLMRAVAWVVVPSIWWENSPLVIQEAFRAGRPVVCSDIGGMAEKVTDGIDGLHFTARDPLALADALERAADPAVRDVAARGIRRPPTHAESAAAHRALYRTARRRRARLATATAGAAPPGTRHDLARHDLIRYTTIDPSSI